jgi:hypothetical protein
VRRGRRLERVRMQFPFAPHCFGARKLNAQKGPRLKGWIESPETCPKASNGVTGKC